jgi:hypothetical protein
MRHLLGPKITSTALALVWASALSTVSQLALAQPQDDAPSPWSVGLLAGHALNANLVDLLPQALQGELEFADSRLGGLVIRRDISPPNWLSQWGQAHQMPVATSLELSVLKSSGLATNTELALDWRPAFTPWQWPALSVEFAWGLGLSQTSGRPWSDYTDPDKPKGYRTLFHMAPEVALRFSGLPDTSLALRVHHRSGLYGVFAPRRVGANHLALVLMQRF